MESKSDLEKHFWMILNEKGAEIHEESKRILLEDIETEVLREPLEYACERYRDLLRPTLVVLSCEAVGGNPEAVVPVAATMTLLGMSLYIFDDIVDRTEYRCFVPTTMGKFGAGKTLIAGGLVTAKAFTLLNQVNLPTQRRRLGKLFWRFLREMAEAEISNLELRKKEKIRSKDKLAVMKMRTVNIEACTRAGAILGFGSNDEIDHLGKFGRHLGLILELVDDLTESLNFTLELNEKVEMGSWPYALTWAENHSENIRDLLSLITDREETDSAYIKKLVGGMFESGAISHVRDLSTRFIARAKEEISNLKHSEAKYALKFIVEAQASFLLPRFS